MTAQVVREPDHVHDQVAADLGIDPQQLAAELADEIASLAPGSDR